MAEYRTLKEICRRMGWARPETLIRKIKNEGFPAYTTLLGKPPQSVYRTNDELIQMWELAKCRMTREELIESKKYESKARSRKAERVLTDIVEGQGDASKG